MNKYYVKHIRQNLKDFKNDCHRFSFWYNGQKEVSCYDAVSVFFDEKDNIPEDVMCEIQNKIYELIEKNESKWSVPKGASEIINTYHETGLMW